MSDDLIARAKERAEAPPTPEEWGYRIRLEENEHFAGRWGGETTDPDNVDDNGNPRRIFLCWDTDGERCFSRFYAALGREIDRVNPSVGDTIVIYRGADYPAQQGTGFAFGVETEPCEDPLPGQPVGPANDGVPF